MLTDLLHKYGISESQLPTVRNYQRTQNLVIVGGGRCVWDDLMEFGWPHSNDVMTVNDITMHYPGHIRHVFSNDRKMLRPWLDARRPLLVQAQEGPTLIHTLREGVQRAHVWPWPGQGTSGLNAVYTGIALGYSQIVLCGIPLDDTGHYFDPPWVKSNFTNEVPDRPDGMRSWKEVPLPTVKSMSGRTRELLGGPG